MEYLGIRFAMLDAIQRYHAEPEQLDKAPGEKISSLKQHIVDASKDNKLLGDQGALVGESWARLIGSKPADTVISFVENPVIKGMTDSLPNLSERAQTMGVPQAVAYVVQNMTALKPMVLGFENLAQETGLINYKGGESLSGQIAHFSQQITAEQGADVPGAVAVAPGTAEIVKQLFDSPNARVDDTFLPVSGRADSLLSKAAGNVLAVLLDIQPVPPSDVVPPEAVKPADVQSWKGREATPPSVTPARKY